MSPIMLLLVVSLQVPAAPHIDSILEAEWKRRGIQPAERCSDEEFLRRITLDLAGRIPTVDEIHRFRAKPDRGAKIDELLEGEDFARFWSEVWTATLNGYANAFESDREVLRQWLQRAIRDEVPYDRQVTELIQARGVSALDGPVNFLVRHPEEPVVKVTRVFLGVRLDCARCHDHPFDRWTQEDFRLMNRFFEATDRQEVSEGNIRLVNRRAEVDEAERPRFLTGARPRTTQWRDELALFITNSKPFARAYVNRIWYQLLGRGMVHPVDDFNRDNPPVVPELMEYLMQEVRRRDFALKPMIRMICNSRAYQLSSRRSQEDTQHQAVFAYFPLKPLTPEQTYDSAVVALGLKSDVQQRRQFIQRTVGRSLDEDFSDTWEYRETVQGLMARLNTSIPATTTSVDELYLRILTRAPTQRERDACRSHKPSDIAFALVNSNEFFFNH